MNTHREELEDIIHNGLAVDLYHADEALSLDMFVGQHANEINKATFGAFFGNLQIILTRNFILHVARMYEQPNKKYPIRSIPAAIKILKEHGDDLAIEQRPGLISALARRGASQDEMDALTDRQLTAYLVSFFEQKFSDARPDGVENPRENALILDDLKKLRDKVVAHPEAIRLDDIPRPLYAEIEGLVDLARGFVSVVGLGYLNEDYYEDANGHSPIAGDAKRSTRCLGRLLRKAGVLPSVKECNKEGNDRA